MSNIQVYNMDVNVMTSIGNYGVVHKRRTQVSKREKTHGK